MSNKFLISLHCVYSFIFVFWVLVLSTILIVLCMFYCFKLCLWCYVFLFFFFSKCRVREIIKKHLKIPYRITLENMLLHVTYYLWRFTYLIFRTIISFDFDRKINKIFYCNWPKKLSFSLERKINCLFQIKKR